MRSALLLSVLCLAACTGSDQPAEEQIPAGSCLQLEVVVDGGFKVDGRAKPLDEVGPALAAALESGDRTAVVDVRCAEGATMKPIRELHDIMLAQGLNRIQYFRDPEPPIPFMLPDAEMTARLDELPEGGSCTVAIMRNGEAVVPGTTYDPSKIGKKLETSPDLVFVIAATDEVKYADFARVLGQMTDAGAQRISVQLSSE